jgi:hypothetical protein
MLRIVVRSFAGRCAALVPVVAALTMFGCGDDGTEEDALSREEYISAVDSICLDFLETVEGWEIPESPDELPEYLDSVIETGDEASQDLGSIQPPPDAEGVHTALRVSLDGSLAQTREARETFAAGDLDAGKHALEEASDIGDDSDQLAKDYGFEVCGSEDEFRGDEQQGDRVAEEPREVDPADLSVGDCVESLEEFDQEALAEGEQFGVPPDLKVPVVACVTPHEYEFFHQFELGNDSYPGDEQMVTLALEGCLAEFESYVGAAWADSELDVFYMYPTEGTWKMGARRVDCLLYHIEGDTLDESVAGSGR